MYRDFNPDTDQRRNPQDSYSNATEMPEVGDVIQLSNGKITVVSDVAWSTRINGLSIFHSISCRIRGDAYNAANFSFIRKSTGDEITALKRSLAVNQAQEIQKTINTLMSVMLETKSGKPILIRGNEAVLNFEREEADLIEEFLLKVKDRRDEKVMQEIACAAEC